MEKELYNKILTLCLKSELYREEWADHVISELDFMGEVEVLPNFWNLYHKVQEIGRPGNKNALNSVVAYILGVTSAQPSGKFCFEKRRTYGRDGFPDIDMDFDYVRRPEIIKYIIDKYGSDHVGNIGTVMRLKTKAALRRVIKALDPEDSIVYDSYGNKIKSNDSDNFRLQNEMLNELPDVMKRVDGTDIESVEDFTNKGGSIKKIKSQLLPKVTPPVHNSAVPHEQKGRWGYDAVKKKIKKTKSIKPARADNPEGITLQSILLEFGVKGTTARKALRVSDIKKPGKQWVWNKTDKVSIKAVRKFIKHLA